MTAALPANTNAARTESLTVAGLFAGIGGFELGFHAAGHRTSLLCEIDDAACRVLSTHFPDVPLVRDVREINALPDVDVVTAGFPCQDLSQAGRTAGITGARSGLVGEVFRLLERANPRWLVLENVPNMLALNGGEAMSYLTHSLEQLGFRWAYRVVNTMAFGLPQRRRRVLLVASRTEDPRGVLFNDDAGEPVATTERARAYGFYWTEGTSGVGWARDAVPTLKGGSTVGIPSPPAIWVRSTGSIETPDVRDAERLQGFSADWTASAVTDVKRRSNPRWKLVGNAVSVPVATWLGRGLGDPQPYRTREDRLLNPGHKWPKAAWSVGEGVHAVKVSEWPEPQALPHLTEFLQYPTTPLSARATTGFLGRAEKSRLRFEDGFLDALRAHVERMLGLEAA